MGLNKFGWKKVNVKKSDLLKLSYDSALQKPVIRCSICTGEQVAGLKDLHTGKFQDVMVIRTEEDLRSFQKMVGVENIEKEY